MTVNNEKSIDGDWHPDWRRVEGSNSFYTHDGLEGKSPAIRVGVFYLLNLKLLPAIIWNKVLLGFNSFYFMYLAMTLMLIQYYDDYRKTKLGIRSNAFLLISVAVLLILCTIIFYFPETNIFVECIKLLVIAASVTLLLLNINSSGIPFVFVTLLMNFLLITVITYGTQRFIEVLDFVFIAGGVFAIISTIERMIYGGREVNSTERT